jgi:hypothetical protein
VSGKIPVEELEAEFNQIKIREQSHVLALQRLRQKLIDAKEGEM